MLTVEAQLHEAGVHPAQVGLLAPLLLVLFVVCVGAVTVPLLGVALSSSRGVVRSWRGNRRRLRRQAELETHARSMMSELCPHGWRAQITLFAAAAAADGAPDDQARVALDWTELEPDGGGPAVMRRVWASTIGEALEAMVLDRRTDETLEQIEQGAVAEGARWPDL